MHKSSVIGVQFDPLTSRVVASASTDGECRITSCFLEAVDSDSNGPFGKVTSFGETLIKLTSIGWVNYVTFSPDATQLCYASKYYKRKLNLSQKKYFTKEIHF